MENSIIISMAQIPVVKGSTTDNLTKHIEAIEQSSLYKADLVVFPELSITGYELEAIQESAFAQEQSEFRELSRASVENNITVIAGCPLRSNYSVKPEIGAVICFPNGSVEFYSKQYLHPGEEKYCCSGSEDYYLGLKGHKIALAICADFASPEHSSRARESGAHIYLVSALISEGGFAEDALKLANIASVHSFPVLLSNHISVTGGWETCGNNSIWGVNGQCVFSSKTIESCLVLCKVSGNKIESAKKT